MAYLNEKEIKGKALNVLRSRVNFRLNKEEARPGTAAKGSSAGNKAKCMAESEIKSKRLIDCLDYAGINFYPSFNEYLVRTICSRTREQNNIFSALIRYNLFSYLLNLYIFAMMFLNKYAFWFFWLRLRKARNSEKPKILIYGSYPEWIKEYDGHTGRYILKNEFFSAPIKMLSESYDFVSVYPLTNYNKPLNSAVYRKLMELFAYKPVAHLPADIFFKKISPIGFFKAVSYFNKLADDIYLDDLRPADAKKKKPDKNLKTQDKRSGKPDFSDEEIENISFNVRYFLKIVAPYAYLLNKISKNIVEELDPKLFMYVAEEDCAKAILMELNKRNIPSLFLQHGIILKDSTIGYFKIREFKGHEIFPSKVGVWNDAAKDCLVKHNCYDYDKVDVIGSIREDMFYDVMQNHDDNRFYLSKRFNISPLKKIILWAPNQIGGMDKGEVKEIIGILENFRSKNEDAEIVIKLHPNEKNQHIRFMRKNTKLPIITGKTGTYKILDAIDILISRYSSIVPEAILFGKPIIVADFFSQFPDFDYVKSGTCLFADEKNKLEPYLSLVLRDKKTLAMLKRKRLAFMQKNNIYVDGRAGERLCREMISLLK